MKTHVNKELTDNLVEKLRDEGVIGGADQADLTPIERNALRRDYLSRRCFVLTVNGCERIHLTLGNDLQDLHDRSQAFSAACGTFACKTLIFCHLDGQQVLGREFASGLGLEESFRTGQTDTNSIINFMEKYQCELMQSAQKSSERAAAAELDDLATAVISQLPLSGDDEMILSKLVVPRLVEQLDERWTVSQMAMGDLAARNIVVTPEGKFLLYDYEFSGRTHFFLEDLLRMLMFSSLGAPVRLYIEQRIGEDMAFLQALFWLRQIGLEARTSTPFALNRDVGQRLGALLHAVERMVSTPGRIRLTAPKRREKQDGIEEPGRDQAIIFWADEPTAFSNDACFSWSYEPLSRWRRLTSPALPTDARYICLAPMTEPGLVGVYVVTFRAVGKRAPPVRWKGIEALSDIKVSGFACCDREVSGFLLFSFCESPRLTIKVPSEILDQGAFTVEFWLCLIPSRLASGQESALPVLLRQRDAAYRNVQDLRRSLRESETTVLRQEALAQEQERQFTLSQQKVNDLTCQQREDRNRIQKQRTKMHADLLAPAAQKRTLQELTRVLDLLRQEQARFAHGPFAWSAARLSDFTLVAKSGLFDRAYYRKNNPDVWWYPPLLHYLLHGVKEGRDPSERFSNSCYVANNPDVTRGGMPPLIHYLRYGMQEERVSTHMAPCMAGQGIDVPVYEEHSAQRSARCDLLRKSKETLPHVTCLVPCQERGMGLAATLAGLRKQQTANWRAVLLNPDAQTRTEICADDDHYSIIDVNEAQTQGGEALWSVLETIDDDWVLFLMPGTVPVDDALGTLALAIIEYPQAVALYADSTITSEDGERRGVYRPDWSPAKLLGFNYVGNTCAFKKAHCLSAIDKLETSPDLWVYSLLLLAAEEGGKVAHVSLALFEDTNTGKAADASGKEDNLRVVEAHVKRMALPLQLVVHERLAHRLSFIPAERDSYPRISIIIPTRDAPQYIGPCLESLYAKTTYPNFEVIVVDNQTRDPLARKVLQQYPIRCLSDDEEFNFSRVNNRAARIAQGEYLVLLNNDTEVVTPQWLSLLLAFAEQPTVGAVGPLLVHEDNTVQHCGVVMRLMQAADHVLRNHSADGDGYFGSLSCTHEVGGVTGACLMVQRSLYDEVGGLNESYNSVFQDVDFCLKLLERGLRNIYVAQAKLIHHESVTRGTDTDLEDKKKIVSVMDDMGMLFDPYYSTNLPYNTVNYINNY